MSTRLGQRLGHMTTQKPPTRKLANKILRYERAYSEELYAQATRFLSNMSDVVPDEEFP